MKEKKTAAAADKEEILSAIRRQYPADQFPRQVFFKLDEILLRHALTILNNSRVPAEEDRDHRRRYIEKSVSLKRILSHHADILILIYEPAIRLFLKKKRVASQVLGDLVQEIISRLLMSKISRIHRHFKFESGCPGRFTSYFMVTIRNIFMDVMRERQRQPQHFADIENLERQVDVSAVQDEPLSQLILDNEMVKLSAIFRMYHESACKLELCVKMKCRVPVSPADVIRTSNACAKSDIEHLTACFQKTNDRYMFEQMVQVFNRWEDKNNQADTLRKWVDLRIDEMILLMNKSHGRKVYTKKSIIDLLIRYFQQRSGIEQIP